MAVDEFSAKSRYHIHITEIALFLRNLGMEHRLHKHVAALLFHIVGVLSVDCVDKFVCLFDKVDSYTLVGLRSVPFAAVVGAQTVHNLFEVGKIKTFAIHKRDARRNNNVLVTAYLRR